MLHLTGQERPGRTLALTLALILRVISINPGYKPKLRFPYFLALVDQNRCPVRITARTEHFHALTPLLRCSHPIPANSALSIAVPY